MRFFLPLLTIVIYSFAFADDFQEMTVELNKKLIESQKQIEPLLKEAASLEVENAKAIAEVTSRETQKKELLTKTETLKNTVKTKVTRNILEDVLPVGKLGNHCRLNVGSQPYEFYLTHDEGFSIRILFAEEGSAKQPEMSIYSQNGKDYHRIVQIDYDPTNANNYSGPMYADIRLDEQKKIVHAVFRGETIKDKGMFGMFGSNHHKRGMTCITMEAVDSI